MTDAPERIWAQAEHEDEGGYGTFWSTHMTDCTATEYVRADIHQQRIDALEAALREIAFKPHIHGKRMADHIAEVENAARAALGLGGKA